VGFARGKRAVAVFTPAGIRGLPHGILDEKPGRLVGPAKSRSAGPFRGAAVPVVARQPMGYLAVGPAGPQRAAGLARGGQCARFSRPWGLSVELRAEPESRDEGRCRHQPPARGAAVLEAQNGSIRFGWHRVTSAISRAGLAGPKSCINLDPIRTFSWPRAWMALGPCRIRGGGASAGPRKPKRRGPCHSCGAPPQQRFRRGGGGSLTKSLGGPAPGGGRPCAARAPGRVWVDQLVVGFGVGAEQAWRKCSHYRGGLDLPLSRTAETEVFVRVAPMTAKNPQSCSVPADDRHGRRFTGWKDRHRRGAWAVVLPCPRRRGRWETAT